MKNTNKTTATTLSVDVYIDSLATDTQADATALVRLMAEATGEPAVMWGSSIVGFGQYHYRYDSGREGDFLRVGFSVRKTAISLYLMMIMYRYEQADATVRVLMEQFGTYKAGRGCIYIKKLADVDTAVLKQLIKISYDATTSTPKQVADF